MTVEVIDMETALAVDTKAKPAALPATRQEYAVSAPRSRDDMLLAAMDKGYTPEQIAAFMDLRDRETRMQAQKAFNEAFAAFKAEAVSIIKNKTVKDGPLKGKSYAELFAVVDAVTPLLSKHGLSTSWKRTKDEPGWIEVACTLKHIGGHAETVTMGGPPDTGGAKNAIQARQSTESYLQRYTLKAILGVAERDEDDDGNGRGPKEPTDVLGLVYDNLLVQLQACATDADAAKLWAIGSKLLHAAGGEQEFADFKDLVAKHRTALRQRGQQ